MRTTISLDDDVFLVARRKAQQEKVSLGQAISELVRQGMRANGAEQSVRTSPKSKYAVLGRRNEIITSELVYALMNQEGI